MNVQFREFLKNSDTVKGFVYDFRKIYRPLFSSRKALVGRYFANNKVRCLHIGAGHDSHKGWLNTDIAPANKNTAFLDMTKPFRFPDNAFDFIYSEHNIEHISYADGLKMLRECRRVLKRGGILRIATPDVEFLLGLDDKRGGQQKEYIEWSAKFSGIEPKALSVINNAFRAWGHQFLYNGEALENSLRKAGFDEVVRERYNESRHEALRGLERHGVNVGNEPMVMCETMVYEAR
jgi:predicted SAM-dependent methyltransferase